MSDSEINVDRVFDLMGVICDESASESDFAEMDTYLLADRSSCNRYLGYCWMHVALSMELQVQMAVQKVHQQINIGSVLPTASEFEITAKAETPAFPSPTFLPTTLHGTLGYLSSDWSVSYLIATVIMGIGALIAGFTYVSHPGQVAEQLSVVTENRSASEPQREYVGRITGLVDCKWANPQTEAIHEAQVFLGHKYALNSGLMEITYDTGTKVILQGPATYEVESRNGGFMAVGKLMGKVGSETAKGFSVRTPTAIVTDLGTEFGVEVSKEGATALHVFRGLVRVQAISGKGRLEGLARVLCENESARVEIGQDKQPMIYSIAVKHREFVRNLPDHIPIKIFNTGINLQEGEPDPHWQIVAVSSDPAFKTRPAVVTAIPYDGSWAWNSPWRSQWISTVGQHPKTAGGVYTFRTTFKLADVRPETAVLKGRFLVDDSIQSLRLNGREVPLRQRGIHRLPYNQYLPFTIDQGFVQGINVLEVDVFNWSDNVTPTFMGLRIEFAGHAMQDENKSSEPQETPVNSRPQDRRKEVISD